MSSQADKNHIFNGNIPKLQALRHMIASMFKMYEADLLIRQQSLWYRPQNPEPEIYFHKTVVSFPLKDDRNRWLKDARKLEVPSKKSDGVAIHVMSMANTYDEFFEEGLKSGRSLWTALFFTWDQDWRYWGIVVRHCAITGAIDIYVDPLDQPKLSEDSGHVESLEKLKDLWGRNERQVALCKHMPRDSHDIRRAFGWRESWCV